MDLGWLSFPLCFFYCSCPVSVCEKIFDILLRQRACQQLLAYAYELETGQKDKDQYVLHALVGEIKERQLAHEERMVSISETERIDSR